MHPHHTLIVSPRAARRLHSSAIRAALMAAAFGLTLASARGQNGSWSQPASGGAWSDPSNWTGGVIADSAGSTADFSALDLPESSNQVILDSSRTLGSLLFGDTGPATPGTWQLAGAGTLTLAGGSKTIATAVDITFGTEVVLDGSEGFIKTGAGTLLLQNPAPTLTGDVRVAGGTLSLGGNATAGALVGTGTILLGNGATLNFATPTLNFINNPITLDAGAHAVLSSAALTNGYGGTVTGPVGSVLEIGGAVSFGVTNAAQFGPFEGTVKIPAGQQLRFSATGTGANGNGGSNATFEVDGILNTRNRANTTGVLIGALTGSGQLQGQTNTAASFVIYRVGGKNLDSTFAGTFVNGAQGPTHLDKLGTGKLTLTGDSPATGNVTVTAGTLQLGDGGGTGSFATPSISVAAGANLVLRRQGTLTLGAVLSGAGRIVQQGSGTTVLSATNTHTAGTEIAGGTLEISAEANLGTGPLSFPSGQGALGSSVAGLTLTRAITVATNASGGFVTRDADDSLTLAGPISGGGSVYAAGPGTISLAAANLHTGGTSVSGGTLVAANPSGSATGTGAVTVFGGALAGAGTISGAVTVESGGALKPGALTATSSSAGTLTTGALALKGGATLYFEFVGATGNDSIRATALTASASAANPVLVDLKLENTAAKWTTPGSYRLIEFSGSFAGNANDLFEVAPASVQSGLGYAFSISGNALVLTITGSAASVWKSDIAGNWHAAGNWTGGIPNAIGAAARFGPIISQPRTIALDAAARVGLLTFDNANPYTISGPSTLTFQTADGSASIPVLKGSHAVNAPVALASGVEIAPAHEEDALAFGGVVGGAGGIVKNGNGALTLTGTNTFSGGVTVNAGTLGFGPDGLGSGSLAVESGTLRWQGGNPDITQGRAVSLGGGNVVFDANGNDVSLAQTFGNGGAASLKVTGGTFTLAAAATHTGGTIVEAGALRLVEGGSLPGAIENNGELRLHRADASHLPNPISGTGVLLHTGGGETTLDAANPFKGVTRIEAGQLTLGNSLALQASSLDYQTGGGSLGFGTLTAATLGALDGGKALALANGSGNPVALTVGANGQAATFGGDLSGPGTLVKAGAGTQTLDGANTYGGNLEVREGVLILRSGTNSPATLLVTGTSTLTLNGGDLTASAPSSVSNAGGTPVFEILGGSAAFPAGLTAPGNQNQPYLIRLAGGNFSASSVSLGRSNLNYATEPAAGDATRGLYVNGGAATIAGPLDIGLIPSVTVNSSASARIDAGSLTVHGATTIGQTSGVRWSVLDVNGGEFVSDDTASGVILGGPTAGNAAFIVQNGRATVERIQIGQAANAGSGVLAVNTSGELYVGAGGIVSGNPGFAGLIRLGKTNFAGGTLAAKASWSGNVPVTLAADGTILAADAAGNPHDITISAPITGVGGLTKSGGGTVSLTGGTSYAGLTYVAAGTLKLSTATLADEAAVEVADEAVLFLDHNSIDTVKELHLDGGWVTGQWGGPGSGARNISTRLAGKGRLQVGVSEIPATFAAWIAGSNLSGNDALPSADPDGDGQSNLLEYALDGAPNDRSITGRLASRIAAIDGGNALVLTLPVRDGASFGGTAARSATVGDLVYTIEGGDNLAVYDRKVEELATPLSDGLPGLSDGWSYRSFRLSGDPATRGPRGFLRARIETQP